jgi:toxin HigB-1
MAIKNIKHKGLRRFHEKGDTSGIDANMAEKLTDRLAALEYSARPEDIGNPPGWKLHPLKGDYKGFWSVWVSGNWRVVFRFEDGDACDVDLIDYH